MPCFFSAFKLRYKRLLLKTSCICLLLPSFSYANMPVIDVTAIGNMVLQYSQMIEEAMKYEKELQKMGIDTGRVGGILGQLDSLTDGILATLKTADELPGTLEYTTGFIKKDCNFLMGDEKFNEKAKKISKKDENKDFIQSIKETGRETLECLVAVEDVVAMTDLAKQYTAEAQKALKNGDMEAYIKQMDALNSLQKTRQSIQKSNMRSKKEAWDKFFTQYESAINSDKNPFSKAGISSRIAALFEQAKKSTTQTDAQNFGNQVMLEILRMAELNYNMMMSFNSTMIAMQDKGEVFDRAEKQKLEMDSSKLQENREQLGVFAKDSPFEDLKGEFKKDALGLPVLDFGKK